MKYIFKRMFTGHGLFQLACLYGLALVVNIEAFSFQWWVYFFCLLGYGCSNYTEGWNERGE